MMIVLMMIACSSPSDTPGTITFSEPDIVGFTPSTVVVASVATEANNVYPPPDNSDTGAGTDGDSGLEEPEGFCDDSAPGILYARILSGGSVLYTRTGLEGSTCSQMSSSVDVDGLSVSVSHDDFGSVGCEPCTGSVEVPLGVLAPGTYEITDLPLMFELEVPEPAL